MAIRFVERPGLLFVHRIWASSNVILQWSKSPALPSQLVPAAASSAEAGSVVQQGEDELELSLSLSRFVDYPLGNPPTDGPYLSVHEMKVELVGELRREWKNLDSVEKGKVLSLLRNIPSHEAASGPLLLSRLWWVVDEDGGTTTRRDSLHSQLAGPLQWHLLKRLQIMAREHIVVRMKFWSGLLAWQNIFIHRQLPPQSEQTDTNTNHSFFGGAFANFFAPDPYPSQHWLFRELIKYPGDAAYKSSKNDLTKARMLLDEMWQR
ncbi:MAG: hypothetical protein HQK53_18070 [Oligoflexia bacterium]|nr:hypothetical protein [Oligoflexia bacterium]